MTYSEWEEAVMVADERWGLALPFEYRLPELVIGCLTNDQLVQYQRLIEEQVEGYMDMTFAEFLCSKPDEE